MKQYCNYVLSLLDECNNEFDTESANVRNVYYHLRFAAVSTTNVTQNQKPMALHIHSSLHCGVEVCGGERCTNGIYHYFEIFLMCYFFFNLHTPIEHL